MFHFNKFQENKIIPFVFTVSGILLLFTIVFTSCTPEIKDTRVNRKWVDSLAKKQKVVIGLEMDSLCELRREKFIKNAIDSILGERLEEMRKFEE